MTTAGLKAALLDSKVLELVVGNGGVEEFEVGTVEVFFPFEYGTSFFSRSWDLIIIEGWFPSINSFIHEVPCCRMKRNVCLFGRYDLSTLIGA